jgi:CubicO group peptidase (beta-lactamase class C family)
VERQDWLTCIDAPGGGQPAYPPRVCKVLVSVQRLPEWITFPEEDWREISIREAGIDEQAFARLLGDLDVRGGAFGGEEHPHGQWGAVLTRGGYLIHAWGDKDYRFQTASTGKAFVWALVGLAVEEGLIDADQPIHHYWTGKGQLSHTHKHLDRGHHKTLTWRHIIGDRRGLEHYGGFAVELGIRWRKRQTGLQDKDVVPGVPAWAKWTGDPFFDLYAHAEPGSVGTYSSGGFWRLGQALTAVWGQDLKSVLDERLFSKLGIASDRWDWLTGQEVRAARFMYPEIPDSYTYLDPPFEIGGHPVRGGPGWVVISASDLARFGHLIATRGMWKGDRLIDEAWLRGHGGGNDSGVSGEATYYTAIAIVTTAGLRADYPRAHATTTESFLPRSAFVGPITVTGR